MAWNTPKTWIDTHDRLNAANLNQYVRDNQVALRSDAAALAGRVTQLDNSKATQADFDTLVQRIAQLEQGGFSDPIVRNISISSGDDRRAKVTNLTPPIDSGLIYLAVRIRRSSTIYWWSAVPLIEYDLWSGFTPVNHDEQVVLNGGNYWPFLIGDPSGAAGDYVSGFVTMGAGGFLAVGVLQNSNTATSRFDRICVRWYL